MKQNLPKILTILNLIPTLTVVLLFVNVFVVVGSKLEDTQVKKETKVSDISINQSVEKAYRVQVCALRKKINDITVLEKACGQSILIVEEFDGYFKYLTSSLTGYTEVLKTVSELKSKPGFEGSFIVLYQNGKRIKPLFTTKSIQVSKQDITHLASSKSERSYVNPPNQSKQEPEKKPNSISIQHHVVDSAASKSKEAIDSAPAVTNNKKKKVQNKVKEINPSIQKVTDFTHQYIPSILLLYVLILFASGFVLLVLFLVISQLIKIKKRHDTITLRELYAEELAKYCSDQSESSQVPELFMEVKNSFRKDLLIDEMIAMISSLTEASGKKISELYFKLQLDFYSFEKLQNRRWTIQAMGIHELAAFNALNEADSVEEFINHPHPLLRHEAISAIVRLRPEDPFGFLDRLRIPFTKRDQLNAISVLKKHHLIVPDFSRWFDSYDPAIVVFAVEMVSQYRQTEAFTKFEKLLKHANEEVRLSVIKAIGDMYLTEYSSRLITVFNDEHEQIQLLILQTMGKLEDPSLLNFLSDLVLFNSFMKIRMEAANALINIGPQGLTRMQTLLLKQDSDISYIYHQIIK